MLDSTLAVGSKAVAELRMEEGATTRKTSEADVEALVACLGGLAVDGKEQKGDDEGILFLPIQEDAAVPECPVTFLEVALGPEVRYRKKVDFPEFLLRRIAFQRASPSLSELKGHFFKFPLSESEIFEAEIVDARPLTSEDDPRVKRNYIITLDLSVSAVTVPCGDITRSHVICVSLLHRMAPI